MRELLTTLIRNYLDGTLSLVEAISMDKVLRSYHKEAAKSRGHKTHSGGRFLEFSSANPQVELQRSAVDIIKEVSLSSKTTVLPTLPALYQEAITDLLSKLTS